MGIVGMTKEHLGLALALNVPVFVVITKIDMCPANVLQVQYRTPSSISVFISSYFTGNHQIAAKNFEVTWLS